MIDTLTDEQLDAARARTHERINDLIVTPPRRSRRLPVLALVATAALAATVTLAPSGTPPTATAATVLRDLEPQPLPTLGDGEYYAVRVVQRGAGDVFEQRFWADANGEGREVTVLDGKTTRDAPLGALPEPQTVPAEQPARPLFPADPKDLPQYLRNLAQLTVPPGDKRHEPTTRDYVLAASQMIVDSRGTPPETLRAVFGFLSSLPGIKLVGDVTDPLGRPGKGIAADGDPEIHEGIGVELIVDPDTGRPLAMVHYRDGDVNDPWLETVRTEGVVKDTETLPG